MAALAIDQLRGLTGDVRVRARPCLLWVRVVEEEEEAEAEEEERD